jgi:hypothetical protein
MFVAALRLADIHRAIGFRQRPCRFRVGCEDRDASRDAGRNGLTASSLANGYQHFVESKSLG